LTIIPKSGYTIRNRFQNYEIDFRITYFLEVFMKKTVVLTMVFAVILSGILWAGGGQAKGAAGGKKQLTLMAHIGEEAGMRYMEQVVKTFMERNSGVNLEIQNMGFDPYVTTLQTKIASNDAPDIFMTEGEQMQTFYRNGYLLNMSGQNFVNNFNPGDLALVTINGELISVPVSFTSMCAIYNKEVFNAAGIQKVPETLNEFYEVLRILKAGGVAPIAAGYKETWCIMADIQTDYILSVLGKDRNAILDLLSRKTTFAGNTLWRDMFGRLFERYQYVSTDPFGTDWSSAVDMLAAGRAAMVLNGSWGVSSFRDKNSTGEIGLFALPVSNNPQDTKLIIMGNSGGYSIFKNTPNPNEALAFMSLFASPEMGSLSARMTNQVSLIRGAEAPAEPAWQDANAYINKGQVLSNGDIDHNFPNEYRVAVETVLSKHLLAGARDVDALLRELDSEFDRIYKSSN
jgi:ABC-type glycerol-3-phosphate transport system substrate-binding protein